MQSRYNFTYYDVQNNIDNYPQYKQNDNKTMMMAENSATKPLSL